MDPLDHLLVDKDTTFALMFEAQSRGHDVLYLPPEALWSEGETVYGQCVPVQLHPKSAPGHVTKFLPVAVDLSTVGAVFIRTDPPFDSEYLYVTLLLERLRGKVLVVNDPRGLRDANEKLYAMHFSSVTPRTLVAHQEDTIRDFLSRLDTPVGVIKPLDGAGGRGVMVLSPSDPNFRSIIETTTAAGRRLCMVQEYLPAVRKGDKRILLLDGVPLGGILRVPREDDLRSNIHVGGRVEATELDADDKRIVDTVAPRLRADGLYFVGLDVIGGRLTEVNVTSPTGIQELGRLSGTHPEGNVLDWVEARAVA